jgi:hypothetical protein
LDCVELEVGLVAVAVLVDDGRPCLALVVE